MDRTFQTNRDTILFYAALSVVVVPFGLINLYHVLTDTGEYTIGFRSLVAPVLPLLTFLSWRNGKLVVGDDGLTIGRTAYRADRHRFALRRERRALKDRPLTSLWKREYDVLAIDGISSGAVRTVSLEMSRGRILSLGLVIATLPSPR